MNQLKKNRRRKKGLYLVIRSFLFIFMLGLGITLILLLNEEPGLAWVDLSDTPAQVIATGVDGEVLYVVLEDKAQPGIYRRDDDNHSWRFAGPGPGVEITALAVHPTNQAVLFAGSEGGPLTKTNNLWRSEDGGQTWRKFFLSLPAHPGGILPAVTTLAVDPQRPEVLYVGTDGQGVYRFDVGPDGYGYSLVGDVAFHDMHIKSLMVGADSQVYALTHDSLFASNNGDTWRKLALPPEMPISLDTAAVGDRRLYALTASGGVYRLTNDEQSWEKMREDWWTVPNATVTGASLTVDKKDPNHVIIATGYEIDGQQVGGNIYETHNAGRNWAKVADLHGVADRLIIDDEAIYARLPGGLVQYREPVTSPSSDLLADIFGLSNLTWVQLFILVLMLMLSGLILLGRIEWLPSPRS